MVKVAINGFGRIGRNFLRCAYREKGIEIVAVNDLTDNATLAHLLKYDSAHGVFHEAVKATDSELIVGGRKIPAGAERDPAKLPWKKMGVDIVIESTGVFRTREDAEKHISAGAGTVIISAPAKSQDIKTIVLGANESEFKKSEDNVVSMASCTTNCLVPMAKVLNDNFGLKKGLMTTVHAYTNDQRLLDLPHKDLRRARSAAVNIVPTTTGAAVASAKVLPELEGKLHGMAIRVPVDDGSLTDLVVELEKETSADEINSAFKKAADGPLNGILEYCTEPIVSKDIVGNPASCVFDSLSTMVLQGDLAKVLGWYDNEMGYSQRMVDFAKYIAKR